MKIRHFHFSLMLLLILLSRLIPANAENRSGGLPEGIDPGVLEVLTMAGKKSAHKLELPLRHTEVSIEVSGFVAQATVVQEYQNPYDQPIEAVYTFPLPEDAAVDSMQMKIGERTIDAVIQKREEARKIYEVAKSEGRQAALLDQQRANVFTQSVAHILPGNTISITLRYVQLLKYQEGHYELIFPMVVGPRYEDNLSGDSQVISPPILPPDLRSGHDIGLTIDLDAGVPIHRVQSISHAISYKTLSSHAQRITLNAQDTLPNKDFVLSYDVAGSVPAIATLAHKQDRDGYFSLMIQPQRTLTTQEINPREMIFIMDTSGSMQGEPMQQVKKAMHKLMSGLRAQDKFNVVRFAKDSGVLWSEAKTASTHNKQAALAYIDTLEGEGGTEMANAILKALDQPAQPGYLRIAVLLTDALVSGEAEILASIRNARRGARVFALGIGSSINRNLLEEATYDGRGEAFYLLPRESIENTIERLFLRIDKPALTYLSIDWQGLPISDIYPNPIPDLWAGQPIRITGRYAKAAKGEISVTGEIGNKPYQQTIAIDLPEQEESHAALASIWARQTIQQGLRDLRHEQDEDKQKQLQQQIIDTALKHHLMTEWTSFVAVDSEKIANPSQQQDTFMQPVELPDGMSYSGVFGNANTQTYRRSLDYYPTNPQSYSESALDQMLETGKVPSNEISYYVQVREADTAQLKKNLSIVSKHKTSTKNQTTHNSETGNILASLLYKPQHTELSQTIRNQLHKVIRLVKLGNIKDQPLTIYAYYRQSNPTSQHIAERRIEVIRDYLLAQGIDKRRIKIKLKTTQSSSKNNLEMLEIREK